MSDEALSEDEQLGVVLVKSGIITIEQLGAALARAKERGCNLARVLIEDNLVTEEQFVGTLAGQLGLEYVDLAAYPVDPAAARLVSETLARRYLAIPIGWWEGRLIVAMADPSNVFAIDDIRPSPGPTSGKWSRPEADHSGDQQVPPQTTTKRRTSVPRRCDARSSPTTSCRTCERSVEDAPIVKLVNVLISQAIADRASDIHIEPTGERRARPLPHRRRAARGDAPPQNIQTGIISRLKVMADINIAERRIPQDGRITTTSSTGAPSTCGSPPCRRCTAKRSSCGSWTSPPPCSRCPIWGSCPTNMDRYEASYSQAVRHHPRHRPDRLGQVDDAVRHAQHPQRARPRTSSRSRTPSSTSSTGSTRSRSMSRRA